VISQNRPRDSSFTLSNTSSGVFQRANSAPQPHASAISRKIAKSESAWPGARRTFFTSRSGARS
jgi:hypothetical protein